MSSQKLIISNEKLTLSSQKFILSSQKFTFFKFGFHISKMYYCIYKYKLVKKITFLREISSDNFYSEIIKLISADYNLTSDSAKKLLGWIYKKSDNGTITLSASDRKNISKDLQISNNQITNNLKKLKDCNLIAGDSGKFIINKDIYLNYNNESTLKIEYDILN